MPRGSGRIRRVDGGLRSYFIGKVVVAADASDAGLDIDVEDRQDLAVAGEIVAIDQIALVVVLYFSRVASALTEKGE